MKRILVTGGLGFIGSNLVDSVISDYEVTVIDDFSSGQLGNVSHHQKNPHFRLVKGSILDTGKIDEAFEDSDLVVHLAAIVSVVRSAEQPRLVDRVNVEGTLNVLESCLKHSVERVIFASSAAVYGNNLVPPFKEDSPPNPLSLYGATKEAGEAYFKAYHKTHGLKTVILRLMNVYGPRRSSGPYAGVMMKFAEAISHQEPLVVFGDGEQTRDFTYVSDVIDAIKLAARRDQAVGETFNIGTGIPSTIERLAKLFSNLGRSKSAIIHAQPRRGEVKASCANIAKAREILGYRPEVGLERGIELFMQWYRGEQAK